MAPTTIQTMPEYGHDKMIKAPTIVPVPARPITPPIELDEKAHNEALANTIHELARFGNPSLFVTPDHQIHVRETPIPIPGPTQVLIHVRATGLCGSDLHFWKHGAIGSLKVDQQCILGHEASGVVLATGSAVMDFRSGDKIAIEPGVPCMTCFLCTAGKYNLCESVAFAGVCPHAGTIRRFTVHESKFCHKMPDNMTFAQGALLEPLSVILHAVSQCGSSLGVGRPALICGAGPIGLIALAVAKASGSWPLVITDVEPSRLEFAKTFCPGVRIYLVDPRKTPVEGAEDIRQLYGCGAGSVRNEIPYSNEYHAPHTVLECTGIESSVITSAYSCRRGGTIMVVGVGRATMNNLPFMHLSLAEKDLRFINRYRDTWPAGINALANHQILNLDSLVTHRFPLQQAVEAMHLSADRTKGSIKVQIVDFERIEV